MRLYLAFLNDVQIKSVYRIVKYLFKAGSKNSCPCCWKLLASIYSQSVNLKASD